MPEVQRIWKVNGKLPIAPGPMIDQAIEYDLPTDWRGIVNGVRVPRGVEAGEANFLIKSENLAGLQTGSITLTCVHENGTTVWPGWYLECFHATTKQSTPAYWVRLRDVRFLLEQSSSEGRRFNLRKASGTGLAAFVADTINGSSPWTWQEVLQELWAYLPAQAGTCPTLPSAPSTYPENLYFDGVGTWRAINQVLTAIGCCVVVHPFTGAISFVSLVNDDPTLSAKLTALTNSQRLLWSDRAGASDYVMPARAGILFHQVPDSGNYAPFLQEPNYQDVDMPGGGQGTHEIVDTWFYYSGRTMTTRTTEIASALYGLLHPAGFPFGAIYSGVATTITPGARISAVEWVSDGEHGMVTKFEYSASPIDWPQLPPHFTVAKAVVFQLTADLDRGVGETASATVVATSSGDPAISDSIIVTNTGEMLGLSGAQGVAIEFEGVWWVVDLNQQALLATFTFTSNSHTSGTFAIANQAAFTTSGFAALTPYPFSDLPGTEVIANPRNLIALNGDMGLAAYNVATGAYQLIQVYPAAARRFMFELTDDWPNGLDQTSTNTALIYADPTHQGGECDNTGFTLRDRYNLAHNAKTGDIGICQLDYETGQFIVHHITHVFTRGRGSVYAGFADGRATFICDDLVGFDGRNPTEPLTVHNELSIESLATDELVELRWNPINGRYYALPPAIAFGVGGPIDYFVLAEDASPLTGRAYMYAYRGDISESTSDINVAVIDDTVTRFKLYHWNRILKITKYAKAGYSGICSRDVKGRMAFVNGACVTGCQADGSITLDLPDGEVGVAYSHTMTGTTIDTSTIDVTGLPDGLTYDSLTQEISGTPTESGLFVLIITATSNNGCEITNAFELTIDAGA